MSEVLLKRIAELERMNQALLMSVQYGKTMCQQTFEAAKAIGLLPFSFFEAR